jgi:hypothetical protein
MTRVSRREIKGLMRPREAWAFEFIEGSGVGFSVIAPAGDGAPGEEEMRGRAARAFRHMIRHPRARYVPMAVYFSKD